MDENTNTHMRECQEHLRSLFCPKTTTFNTPLPKIGDYIKPDGWVRGKLLYAGTNKSDTFVGCDFRIGTGTAKYPHLLAANVVVIDDQYDKNGCVRCRIEFVSECGDHSVFINGKIHVS